MEPAPRLDASPPSRLRVAGFLLVAAAALLSGVAGVQTWVSVGFRKLPGISPAVPGIDLWEGKVVLGCALVMLLAVLTTRLARSPAARKAAATLALAAGLVTVAVSGAFILTATSRFDPVNSEAVARAIAEQTGQPLAAVEATLAEVVQTLGGYTDVAVGPFLAILGGGLGFVGGLLTLSWTARIAAAPTAPIAS